MALSVTPVNNYLVPATGTTNSVPVVGPFSATPTPVDFREISLNGEQFVPSGVFIDNSAGAAPLVITIQGMQGFSIVCPAGARTARQYPAPIDQICSITGNGNAVCIFTDFPVLPWLDTAAGGGASAVTIADGADVTLGAQADAPAANDTGAFSLMSFIKRISGNITGIFNRTPALGATTSANSSPVVIATDDVQIGTKVTAIPALGAGGAGIIGWLSTIVGKYSANGFPVGATPWAFASANANAINTLTAPAVAGKTNYISSLQIMSGGSTAGAIQLCPLAGVQGGTINYVCEAPTGGLLFGKPIIVNFNPPLPASAVNTAITLTMPASGAGTNVQSVAMQGYVL